MHWNESWYFDIYSKKEYKICITFAADEKELEDTVINFLCSKRFISAIQADKLRESSSPVVVSQLPLSSKNALTAYLQGILDGMSSYETEVDYWKRQLNSIYGISVFGIGEKPQDESVNTAVSALRQRTLRTEKKLDEKAIVINETVDKVSALQHKVDELEAYIKFIHPQYPFVLDDITGSKKKKKKGWFNK